MRTRPLKFGQVIKIVKDVLATETSLRIKSGNRWEADICVDYRGRLEGQVLQEILKKENPKKLLEDLLAEWYGNCERDCKQNILGVVEACFYQNNCQISYHIYEKAIRRWIDRHLLFCYPNGRIMDQWTKACLKESNSMARST